MAFKMKGFSGFKQTSPVGELLGMMEEYTETGEGPRGTIQEGGKKRDMTPGEMASQRYIAKTVRDKVPEKHRADFNYQLSKGRLDGDTLEDQAQALHKTMSSPAKQKKEYKVPSAEERRELEQRVSEKTGKNMKYWESASRKDSDHRFMDIGKTSKKSPEP